MDRRRGKVASAANHFGLRSIPELSSFWAGAGGWAPTKVPFRLGLWAVELKLGASGFDGPSAPRDQPEPCPPSIRKRCACGFPQGTAEPLRHASN